MTNHLKFEGALDASGRKQINDAIGDVALCTTAFSATSSDTGTTLTNVTGLTSGVLTPGTYEVDINLIVTGTTNSGFKAALKQSVANMVSALSLSVTGITASAIAGSTFTTTTDATAFIGATSAYVNVKAKGFVVIDNAGTLTIQAAQNASHADATTVALRSSMRLLKVA